MTCPCVSDAVPIITLLHACGLLQVSSTITNKEFEAMIAEMQG